MKQRQSLGPPQRRSFQPFNLHNGPASAAIADGFLQVVVSKAREQTVTLLDLAPSRFRYNPRTYRELAQRASQVPLAIGTIRRIRLRFYDVRGFTVGDRRGGLGLEIVYPSEFHRKPDRH
jgi:hypothetical protein